MNSLERLLAERDVAARIASATTNPQTAREIRRYLREIEDQMRDLPITTASVSI